MKRYELKIIGNVQGVFFRVHSVSKAEKLGVTGWVANDADGTVSIVAEGSSNKLNEFADWCLSGPSRATVEKVEIKEAPYMAEFNDFSIRY